MGRRTEMAKAELEVARIVWQLGEARVRVVVEALPPGRRAGFWTVQTHLRRLKAKGYLRTRSEGRTHVYLPAVSPGRVLRDVIRDFVDRAFGGQPLPLVQHLIRDTELTDAEIDQLQATLDALKQGRKPS